MNGLWNLRKCVVSMDRGWLRLRNVSIDSLLYYPSDFATRNLIHL
jgi:hypothetical protein